MKVKARLKADAHIMDAIHEGIQWCERQGQPDDVGSVFTSVRLDPSPTRDTKWELTFCFHDGKVVVTADSDPYLALARWVERVTTPCSVPDLV